MKERVDGTMCPAAGHSRGGSAAGNKSVGQYWREYRLSAGPMAASKALPGGVGPPLPTQGYSAIMTRSRVEHQNMGGGIIFAHWEVGVMYRLDPTVEMVARQSPTPKSG